MRALWKSAARVGGALRIAKPLAYEPAHLALWQLAVEGPTLASLEASGPQFVPLLEAAGRAVATLHAANSTRSHECHHGHLEAALREAATRLRGVPPLARRVARFTHKLLGRAPEVCTESATLHGDLHAKNGIYRGRCSTYRSRQSPLRRSGSDLGSFVASTCARALAYQIKPSAIGPMVSALVCAYEAAARREVPDRRCGGIRPRH